MNYTIHTGDNRDILPTLDDCSIDSVVTDPPYGIDFLGKSWDANTGALETYEQCLRALKPGGYILAFSAARTYHHLAVTLEQAGFEIKDQIMWLYTSGFPKSQQIPGHKGWKTGLKPAHEPICVARRPTQGSTRENMDRWGVGALNIDANRIPWGEDDDPEAYMEWMRRYPQSTGSREVFNNSWAEAQGKTRTRDCDSEANLTRTVEDRATGRYPSNVIGSVEGYQKYFLEPKVTRQERGTNPHPTLKPVELMRHLVGLVTPPGGCVLDPFCGSGTTGVAALSLGMTFVGCELDPEYVSVADRRMSDPRVQLFEQAL